MRDEKITVESLISAYNTNNPFCIAKEKRIIVLFEPLGDALGYYNFYVRHKMIHINRDAPSYMKTFICAHELGHSILHPDVNTPFLKKHTLFSTDKIEREANIFAVELLLPDFLIRESGENSLYALAARYGIPQKLAELKVIKKI